MRFLAIAGLAAALMLLMAGDAHAIRVTVKRVVFEGSKRAEVLTLVNDSPQEQTYRIGWRNMVMRVDHPLSPVENQTPAPEQDARASIADMVVFAPRRVTIAPGESQQIRLMLRKPQDLADGEYRGHLWVRPEAESVRFDHPEKIENGIQIKMLAGLSFPVFVRQGQLPGAASMEITSVSRDRDVLHLDLALNRGGGRSLYGDIIISCVNGNADREIYRLGGIAVYMELEQRPLALSVPLAADPAASCPKIRAIYRAEQSDLYYRGKAMAEASTVLP